MNQASHLPSRKTKVFTAVSLPTSRKSKEPRHDKPGKIYPRLGHTASVDFSALAKTPFAKGRREKTWHTAVWALSTDEPCMYCQAPPNEKTSTGREGVVPIASCEHASPARFTNGHQNKVSFLGCMCTRIIPGRHMAACAHKSFVGKAQVRPTMRARQ